MAFHINYWSCSRFGDIVRGTPKPISGTSREWKEWKLEAKAAHPIRYWIVEEAFDQLQDLVCSPLTLLDSVRYYINNRWVTKTHALTAHPKNIKPGTWCDVGNRFLPCMFDELVNFVEVELAWHNCRCDSKAEEKFNPPWWRKNWLRLRTWRSPEAGLEHLNWSATSPNVPEGQARAAVEIMELYRWWKEVYPNRPDPHVASGWDLICSNRGFEDLFDTESRTPEQLEAINLSLDKIQEIEEAYEKEDTEMLTRLILIRGSLWT